MEFPLATRLVDGHFLHFELDKGPSRASCALQNGNSVCSLGPAGSSTDSALRGSFCFERLRILEALVHF